MGKKLLKGDLLIFVFIMLTFFISNVFVIFADGSCFKEKLVVCACVLLIWT